MFNGVRKVYLNACHATVINKCSFIIMIHNSSGIEEDSICVN
jgi:hypothetical protein